jgi:hypothetical protein
MCFSILPNWTCDCGHSKKKVCERTILKSCNHIWFKQILEFRECGVLENKMSSDFFNVISSWIDVKLI